MSVPPRPDVEDRHPARDERATLPSRGAALTLFGSLVAPLVIPGLGVLPSLAVLGLGPAMGSRIWPGRSRWHVIVSTVLAFGAFWLGPFLSIAAIAPLRSAWLAIPLCGPESAAGWLVPAVAALLPYTAGCVLSVRLGRPILWPIATFAAASVYELTLLAFEAGGADWIC
ncbi:MAG TPA: hypothetical protein VFZ75_02840 [Actinomycetota bacterium]|nr:hypothetical protein [Actinomycetota bacterium]